MALILTDNETGYVRNVSGKSKEINFIKTDTMYLNIGSYF